MTSEFKSRLTRSRIVVSTQVQQTIAARKVEPPRQEPKQVRVVSITVHVD